MKSARKRKKRGRKSKSGGARSPAFPYRAYAKRPIDPGQAEFLDETIAIWQPRTDRPLSREDAREIVENITGFFSILREWDRADRQAGAISAVALSAKGNTRQSIEHQQGEDVEDLEAPPDSAGR